MKQTSVEAGAKTGTLAAFARHRGVSPGYVTKLRQAGRLVLMSEQPVLVDFVASDRLIRATTQLGSAGNGANAGGRGEAAPRNPDADRIGLVYRQSQAQHKAFGAKLAELEFRQRSGQLLDRHRVEAGVFEAFRAIRDRVLAVSQRVAPVVVGMELVREIELAIADELRRALGDSAEPIVAKVTKLDPTANLATTP